MKITLINASPKPVGVTARVAGIISEAIKSTLPDAEISTLNPSKMYIIPCKHCDACIKTGYCINKDKDDAQGALDTINDSDLVIVATPVYYAGVPGAFKSFIDRAQVLWNKRYILNENLYTKIRKALMVSTCGSKGKSMFECNFQCLYYFFDSFGVKFIKEEDILTFWKKEKPDDISNEEIKAITKLVNESATKLLGQEKE